jgi:hypothetical protein
VIIIHEIHCSGVFTWCFPKKSVLLLGEKEVLVLHAAALLVAIIKPALKINHHLI